MSSLFYYTSVDTASKILDGGTMWATNIRYMNDSEELSNGLNEIEKYNGSNKENIKLCISELRKEKCIMHYTLSFSGHEDSLSQWSMYSKESGVSLEMDFGDEDLRLKYDLENYELENPQEAVIKHVIYCTSSSNGMPSNELSKTEEEISKMVEDYCGNELASLPTIRESVAQCAALIKRYEFYQEDEYRVIFNLNNVDTTEKSPIFYRTDANVLKSFIKVKCRNSGNVGWPVVSVMVGPGFNQDVVFNSLIFFLDNSDIHIAKITHNTYVQRAKKYLLEGVKKLTNKSGIQKLNDLINSYKWNCCDGFEDPEFSSQMQIEVNLIAEKLMAEATNGAYITLDFKEYWDNNYFSRTSIVLKKSSIPYIF